MPEEKSPNILAYAGLLRFGKEKSKLKISPKELIIIIIIFAIIFAALDYIFGIFF